MTTIPDVHALPIAAAPVGYTTPLIAFWVGDHDVFAAPSAEQVLDLRSELAAVKAPGWLMGTE